MEIPLDTFEQRIDKTILKRGFDYFKKGYVIEFTKKASGTYEAIVEGTEEYLVSLKINDHNIKEHNCNCPYDIGPICKHIVAAIFYLQKDTIDLTVKSAKNPKTKKTKKKTVAEQLSTIMGTISHKELQEFTLKTAKTDRIFRNLVLASFSYLNENQSKSFYQNQISSILKSVAGRDGYIDWSGMKFMNKGLEPFVENTSRYLENHSYQNVFNISVALLEEMTKAFNFGDDSNGDIGYHIDFAIGNLHQLTQIPLENSLRIEFFEYCISAFNKKLFSGWDWHLDMLQIAEKLITNKKEADTVLKSLVEIDTTYGKEHAEALELKIIRRYKKKEEVSAFIEKNIGNPILRKAEILEAFNTGNFERAAQLAKDGIIFDKEKKPGLLSQWYDWLLKIAQKQKNNDQIIEYARYRFLNNFRGTDNYYKILKETVKEEKWNSFLEEIIVEITPNQGWQYTALLREIFINEGWWDRLFLMLKENTSLANIAQEEEYLKDEYSLELIGLYSERIKNYLNKNVGRSNYKTACKYLRRIKKLGGKDQLAELVDTFRKQYANRPALLDELSKL